MKVIRELWLTFYAVVSFSGITQVFAHCEIPCGIYNDTLRILLIEEHIGTLEKSMISIINNQKENSINKNQLIRWINNKEAHANKIQHIVVQYFLTQRIKPVKSDKKATNEKYMKELTLLHEILIYAMKSKQTTDLTNVKYLRERITQFKRSYFRKK